jgi:photosystem II stability/assembly factor-like uncharacterized protein
MLKCVRIFFTICILSSNLISQNQTFVPSALGTYGIAENSTGDIFIGASDHPPRILISTDAGLTWTYSDSGTNNMSSEAQYIKIDNNDKIFFTGKGANIHRSTDNGNSWEFLNAFWDVRSFSISNNNFVFAGVDDQPTLYLVRSTDSGNTWEDITSIIHRPVWALESFQNHIYAGAEGRLYHSSDYGVSWDSITIFTSGSILTIFINDSNYIFVGTWGDGVYISKDEALSWQKIFSSTKCISSIQEDHEGFLFITQGGYCYSSEKVFRSSDSGLNWTKTENGLPDIWLSSLFIASDNSLYLTSHGHGIYKSTNKGENWFQVGPLSGIKDENKELPKEFGLNQNYPNPFNPSTKISWQSPVGGHQTLKIYDVLGNQVANLIDEYRNAGSYEVEFKSSVGSLQLASGIYFYRLQAGSFVQTKKMVLIK